MPAEPPDGRDTPGVIAPPPLLFIGTLAAALAVDYGIGGPSLGLASVARAVVAVPLLALGAALIGGALGRFRRAGTPAQPWKPVSALVVAGVYKLTRNPMYLGMLLIYLGIAVALDSVVALAFAVPLVPVVQTGVIAREERYMAGRFGTDYAAYRTRVRRWI